MNYFHDWKKSDPKYGRCLICHWQLNFKFLSTLPGLWEHCVQGNVNTQTQLYMHLQKHPCSNAMQHKIPPCRAQLARHTYHKSDATKTAALFRYHTSCYTKALNLHLNNVPFLPVEVTVEHRTRNRVGYPPTNHPLKGIWRFLAKLVSQSFYLIVVFTLSFWTFASKCPILCQLLSI